MLEIASEIAICLLLSALIGFVIGYLVAKKRTTISKEIEELDTQAPKEHEAQKIPTDQATKEAIEAFKALQAQEKAQEEQTKS